MKRFFSLAFIYSTATLAALLAIAIGVVGLPFMLISCGVGHVITRLLEVASSVLDLKDELP